MLSGDSRPGSLHITTGGCDWGALAGPCGSDRGSMTSAKAFKHESQQQLERRRRGFLGCGTPAIRVSSRRFEACGRCRWSCDGLRRVVEAREWVGERVDGRLNRGCRQRAGLGRCQQYPGFGGCGACRVAAAQRSKSSESSERSAQRRCNAGAGMRPSSWPAREQAG